MDAKDSFSKSFMAGARSVLEPIGFKENKCGLVRSSGTVIDCLSIHQSGKKRRIELGVTFSFVVPDRVLDTSEMTAADCEIKQFLPEGVDAWYGTGSSEGERALSHMEAAIAFFRPYEDINKLFSPMTMGEILRSGLPKVFPGVTGIRSLLILAKYNIDRGRFSIAQELASYGIENCGDARALKGTFEQIVKDASRSA